MCTIVFVSDVMHCPKVLLRGKICEYLCFQFKLENYKQNTSAECLAEWMVCPNNTWNYMVGATAPLVL